MTLGHTWPPAQFVLIATQAGWLGVEVFFALSGYLITGILLETKSLSPARFFGRFYFRRALRILPLYFGVLLFFLVLPFLFRSLDSPDFERFREMQGWFWLHAANMAREYHGTSLPALEFGWFELTHFWTLAVEEHFYLVWPFLVYFVSLRWLVINSLLLIVISIVLRTGIIDINTPLAAALVATPKSLSGLVVGGLAAVWIHVSGKESIVHSAAFLGGLTTLGLIALFVIAGTSSQAPAFRSAAAALAELATASAAVVVTCRPTGRIGLALTRPVFLIYGKYSYGIYIFHILLGPWTRTVNLTAWPGGYTFGAICYVLLFLLVPLGVAIVSYHYWELPWIRLKSRFPKTVSPQASKAL